MAGLRVLALLSIEHIWRNQHIGVAHAFHFIISFPFFFAVRWLVGTRRNLTEIDLSLLVNGFGPVCAFGLNRHTLVLSLLLLPGA